MDLFIYQKLKEMVETHQPIITCKHYLKGLKIAGMIDDKEYEEWSCEIYNSHPY